jgi:hypothetical protein
MENDKKLEQPWRKWYKPGAVKATDHLVVPYMAAGNSK